MLAKTAKRSKMKELKTLVQSGHGSWIKEVVHIQFGQGLWKYDNQVCRIQIFQNGIFFKDNSDNEVNMRFEEIKEIKSFLTAQAIAEASNHENVLEVSLPMQIITDENQFFFNIPLVIYSAVLITIQEYRKAVNSD